MTAGNRDAAAAPPWVAKLVDRAARQIESQWPCTAVQFPWWTDGADILYRARLVWLSGEPAPRVEVCDARSGDFVCRSLPADLYAVDSTRWEPVCPEDEAERINARQHRQPRAGQ